MSELCIIIVTCITKKIIVSSEHERFTKKYLSFNRTKLLVALRMNVGLLIIPCYYVLCL